MTQTVVDTAAAEPENLCGKRYQHEAGIKLGHELVRRPTDTDTDADSLKDPLRHDLERTGSP